MKKIFFLTLLVLLSLPTVAQTTGIIYANRWKAIERCPSPEFSEWREVSYLLGMDSVIEGQTYQTIILPDRRIPFRYSNDGLQLYYRGIRAEYLLCDFSLPAGKKFRAYAGTGGCRYEEDIWLDMGDSICPIWTILSNQLIDGCHHVVMAYTDKEGKEHQSKMIQGIGSPSGIFPASYEKYCDGTCERLVLCAFNDDEHLYSYDLTSVGICNNCEQWSHISNDIQNTSAASKAILLLLNGSIVVLNNGMLYNILGARVQ